MPAMVGDKRGDAPKKTNAVLQTFLRPSFVASSIPVATNVANFEVDHVQYIAAQLVAGLQHMHYRGLVHRDMKLSNILITDAGKVKIIDFDTAKMGLALSAKHFSM